MHFPSNQTQKHKCFLCNLSLFLWVLTLYVFSTLSLSSNWTWPSIHHRRSSPPPVQVVVLSFLTANPTLLNPIYPISLFNLRMSPLKSLVFLGLGVSKDESGHCKWVLEEYWEGRHNFCIGWRTPLFTTVVMLLLAFIPNGSCTSTTSLMRIWNILDLFFF